MTIGLRTSWLQYPVETFTSPYKSRHKDATAWMTPHLVSLMIAHSRPPVNPSSGHIPPPSPWPPSASQARHLPHTWKATLPSQPPKPTKSPEQKALRGTASAVERVYSLPLRLYGACCTLKRRPASFKEHGQRLLDITLAQELDGTADDKDSEHLADEEQHIPR